MQRPMSPCPMGQSKEAKRRPHIPSARKGQRARLGGSRGRFALASQETPLGITENQATRSRDAPGSALLNKPQLFQLVPCKKPQTMFTKPQWLRSSIVLNHESQFTNHSGSHRKVKQNQSIPNVVCLFLFLT